MKFSTIAKIALGTLGCAPRVHRSIRFISSACPLLRITSARSHRNSTLSTITCISRCRMRTVTTALCMLIDTIRRATCQETIWPMWLSRKNLTFNTTTIDDKLLSRTIGSSNGTIPKGQTTGNASPATKAEGELNQGARRFRHLTPMRNLFRTTNLRVVRIRRIAVLLPVPK